MYGNFIGPFAQIGPNCTQQNALNALSPGQAASYQQQFQAFVAGPVQAAVANQATLAAKSYSDGSTSPALTHPFINNTNTLSLTALSFVNSSGTNPQTMAGFVHPQNGKPTPAQTAFTFSPPSGNGPLPVTFTAPTVPPGGTNPLAAYYDFGDGTVQPEPDFFHPTSASHTYNNPGAYVVKYCQSYPGVTQNTANCPPQATPIGTVQVIGFNTSSADSDGDGLTDAFEAAIASDLALYYHISAGEHTGTGFATFLDQTTEVANQVFGSTPPIVNYAVTPYGFATDNSGHEYAAVRIDYLTLWNRDDGLEVNGNTACIAGLAAELGPLFGFTTTQILQGVGGHVNDNERSALLAYAPTTNNQLVQDPTKYKLGGVYLAAHESTVFDHSEYYYPTGPFSTWPSVVAADGTSPHGEVFISRAKHSTYAQNPAGQSIVPYYQQAIVYGVLLGFLGDCIANAYDDQDVFVCIIEYSIYAGEAATVFGCISESFTEQGGSFANRTINVGEPNDPLNGAHYILDPSLEPKLTGRLF